MTMKIIMKSHWEKIYETKSPTEVSWYQMHPSLSLSIIESTGVKKDHCIIDVGGGASLLVDSLLDAGYEDLAVLDISGCLSKYRKPDWVTGVTMFSGLRRM